MDRGEALSYAGDSMQDENGVRWYRVRFRDTTGWVSTATAKRGKRHPNNPLSQDPRQSRRSGEGVFVCPGGEDERQPRFHCAVC